jgi:hypothetical protein
MCLSWIIGTQGFVGEIGGEDEGGNGTGNCVSICVTAVL